MRSFLKNKALLPFMLCFAGSSYAQVFIPSLIATPNQLTCFSGSRGVSYSASVIPPVGYVYGTDYTYTLASTDFKLRLASASSTSTPIATNTGGTVISGTINGSFDLVALSQPPEVYTIYAKITINNIKDKKSQVVNTTTTFVIGYDINWLNMIDMQALPNAISCRRATTSSGVTYARAFSSNKLAPSTSGWIMTAAQFGGTTGSVFFVVGDVTSTLTDPTTAANYVEYRKTGTSSGQVIVRTGGVSTILTGVNHLTQIMLKRSGSNIQLYLPGAASPIASAPTISYTSTNKLNVSVFAQNLNDGARDIQTSFDCVFDNQFFHLKEDVEQSLAYLQLAAGYLRIKYDEDYFDANGTLNYTVRCLNDDTTPTTVTVNKPVHTNWIEIPIGTGGIVLTSGKIYLLEVKDSKNRKMYLKFKTS